MEDVTLKLSGKVYTGWKSFSVSSSMETLCSSFSLEATDNWTGNPQATPWPILPGTPCQVLIGSDSLITGYVDDFDPSYAAESRGIRVNGRDKTSDLVDCSAKLPPYSFNSILLETLAGLLAKPFGVSVIKDVSTGGPLVNFHISPGESCFQVLDRCAKQKGVLLLSDSNGALHIAHPGTTIASTSLVQGQNILQATGSFSFKERFSEYIVGAQERAFTEPTVGISQQIKGRATDPMVTRFRPLVILNQNQAAIVTAQTRANYEAILRAGRSSKVSITVAGFRQKSGSLWQINQLTHVKSPWLNVDDDLLITGVSFGCDLTGGQITTLELKRKDAFFPVEKVQTKDEIQRALVQQNQKTSVLK